MVVGAAVATVVAACYYTGTYPKQLKIWLHKKQVGKLLSRIELSGNDKAKRVAAHEELKKYLCEKLHFTRDDLESRNYSSIMVGVFKGCFSYSEAAGRLLGGMLL